MSDTEDQRIRVMLIDDNQIFLRAASTFLERHEDFLIVCTAHEEDAAITQAQEQHPDIVLLDLDMPGQSGLTMIPKLRAACPRLSIIVLTMLNGSAYQQAARRAGSDGFVRKAEMYTDLLPAMRDLLDRHN